MGAVGEGRGKGQIAILKWLKTFMLPGMEGHRVLWSEYSAWGHVRIPVQGSRSDVTSQKCHRKVPT